MTKSILFSRPARTAFLLLATMVFAFSGLLLGSQTAQMQTAGANRIVFDSLGLSESPSKIYTINADGTGKTELGYGYNPAWSPDGTKIVYAREGDNAEAINLWTMNADGSNQVKLTDDDIPNNSPAWSPDGTRIAFYNDDAGGHIFIINADGTNRQQLNVAAAGTTGEFYPVWTPDGSKIVFVAANGGTGNNDDFYAAAADNSGVVTRLTYMNAYLNSARVSVAPDGQSFIFAHDGEIYSAPMDGSGTVTNLTNSDGFSETFPAFSPNGAKIVFGQDDGNLFVMNADGSNLTDLGAPGRYPSWNPTAIAPPPTVTPTPVITPTPVAPVDVAVEMSASPARIQINQETTYTINVRNNGSATATNVVLSDELPASLTVTAFTASQGVCGTGIPVTCHVGTLEPNASAVFTMRVRAASTGQIVNKISVTSAEPDAAQSNNSSTVTIQVTPTCRADVTAQLQIMRMPMVRQGNTNRYHQIIYVRNDSGRALSFDTALAFDNLNSGVRLAPTVLRGYTTCNEPLNSPVAYYYPNSTAQWQPGRVLIFRVSFENPSRRRINYRLRVLNGAGLP